ncbi:hypothetical protein GCM10009609_33720 [Pseudonocardia aurantiaca]|uniref:ANTAR domain-containing protein n=1 Tax=Pseudonocardia aurantiaca TaxID=75290 RepID=A0ABW4FRB3_9PSEU
MTISLRVWDGDLSVRVTAVHRARRPGTQMGQLAVAAAAVKLRLAAVSRDVWLRLVADNPTRRELALRTCHRLGSVMLRPVGSSGPR